MTPSPKTFLHDESGAVTVDWVVLTAAIVGLGLAVATVVSGGIQDLSNDIDDQLEADGIIRVSFSQLGETTQLTGQDLANLQAEARGASNTELQTAFTTAQAGISPDQGVWQAAIDGGATLENGTYTYLDGDGATQSFEAADYEASVLASDQAAVYADEAQQRGITLN